MITQIRLSSFKCFQHLELDFGSLTLLTGHNGAGKSTALQPLLMLAQARQALGPVSRFALNGGLVRLGSASDVVPWGSAAAVVEFGVTSESAEVSWTLSATAGARVLEAIEGGGSEKLDREAPSGVISPMTDLRQLVRSIVYLGAARDASLDTHPMEEPPGGVRGDVGVLGSHAGYWLDLLSDEPVVEDRRIFPESGDSLRRQLDACLSFLFPGAQVTAQALPLASQVAVQFRMSSIGEWHRPANVGFGLSYAFPLLVALLVVERGQMVIVDSPEAHLHPAAQSRMGRLLASFAARGVQIVAETHSDHLLNGVRLAVRDGSLAAGAVRFQFFDRAEGGVPILHSPRLDSAGRISDWPEGFFDQAELDLARLTDLG